MDFLIALLNNSDALLHSTLVAATPLLFAALGETFVQRAGIINIGLEGILLTGAFAGMTASYFSGSPLLGLIVGAVSGLLLALLFAGLTVGLSADQIVVGVGLNLLAAGLTGVLYRGIFGVTGQALQVSTFLPIHIPFFSTLPILGSSLFQHAGLVYLAITLVPICTFFLFYLRAGLQLQAVGEHPHAAETLGISVKRVRFLALAFEGVLGGIAGSYLSLAYSNTFIEGMSAGRGFIALAIVIFGRWNPTGALWGALFFGVATALQFHLQALGSELPYQIVLMLPYVLTLLALMLLKTSATAPAALGQPYHRE
ncbi:MAG: ABC transporter permease [Deltaproteobacteria bacterium]|nr:ABC transporter permease [Deltaproteobacteria bacterium]